MKNYFKTLFILTISILFYVNLNSQSLPNIIGSCNQITTQNICTDYIGSIWNEAAIKSECQNGFFSNQPCSKENLFGTCNRNRNNKFETFMNFYINGPLKIYPDKLKAVCENTAGLQGVWINVAP